VEHEGLFIFDTLHFAYRPPQRFTKQRASGEAINLPSNVVRVGNIRYTLLLLPSSYRSYLR